MSLTMMALRICAVQALKSGGTIVGDNVLDSQISAIDLTADGRLSSDEERPFIAVYTDAAKSQDLGPVGLRANGQVELIFNCGVSLAMVKTDKETGESEIIEGFPATDANLEATLDVLDVQICRVLCSPDNPWSQIFGNFVQAYISKEHLRSSSNAENVRLAAGQIKLLVNVMPDPAYGQPLAEGGPWPRFLALMEEQGLPKLTWFQRLIGAAAIGPYAEYERLTGMSIRDAESLRLYAYGDVARDVVIKEASGEPVPY